MKFLININIKYKLGILFLILCLSILILAFKSISISEDMKSTLGGVHSKSQEVLQLKNEIITPLYALREITQSLVMAPNKTIREEIEKELDALLITLDKEFQSFGKNHTQIYSMWLHYKNLIGYTKQYLEEEFDEGAYVNVTKNSREQFNALLGELSYIQNAYLNNASIAYSEAESSTKKVKLEVFLLIGVVLFFAIMSGFFITHNILNSIYSVQNGLNEFFDYLNHKRTKVQRIEIESKDEFSQMASTINQNVSVIKNNIEQNEVLIKNATKVLKNIEEGNLGMRLSQETNNVALDELQKMINSMIGSLEHKIQQEIAKRMEQEQILIQQSKLAAMGEMIGNIAHQWRQPLTQISAIHMNMKVTYDFDKFDKAYLDKKIKEATKLTRYMSQTISDFQNFFKPQGKKEHFSIEHACKEAHFIIESSLKYHGITFKIDLEEDSEVFGYKNEYSQVILNILSNAKDILLERKIENPCICLSIKTGDNFAIVKIQDNGGGVDDTIIDKIFEPYFTTRHKTQGTGIGLYMSKNIIERNMNGFINVRNEKNGALFTVKVAK
jgi:signal transduction histidine kinase